MSWEDDIHITLDSKKPEIHSVVTRPQPAFAAKAEIAQERLVGYGFSREAALQDLRAHARRRGYAISHDALVKHEDQAVDRGKVGVADARDVSDRVMRFLGGLDLHDHPLAEQREQRELVHLMMGALKPHRNDK